MSKQTAETSTDKPAENGRKRDGRFEKGNKGGGRPRLDPDVKAMLVDATPERIRRLEMLSKKAEDAKDYKTAAHIELGLLKKVVPDTNEFLLSTPTGESVKVEVKEAPISMKRLQRIASILKDAGALTEGPGDSGD